MVILIYYPGFIIPTTIQYCDNFVQSPHRLDIIQDNEVIFSVSDYSHFVYFDNNIEEGVVQLIKEFITKLDELNE